nr:MAG TPA: hypothetical protein [Caudoviricetes sp.]
MLQESQIQKFGTQKVESRILQIMQRKQMFQKSTLVIL